MKKDKPEGGSKNLFIINLRQYLEETTVHGFRYVATGINAAERFFWILCIVSGFSGAFYMVNRSLVEGRDNPILTTIDTVPVESVPFPAVSIDAIDFLNPWGFIAKLYNQVDFECYDNFKNCTHAQEVREDFGLLIKAVTEVLTQSIRESLKNKTLEDMEDEISGDNMMKRGLGKPYSYSVAILAAMKIAAPDGFKEAQVEIAKIGVDAFARYSMWNIPKFFGEPFKDMLESKKDKFNISLELVNQCSRGGNSTCSTSLLSAHLILYPIFAVQRIAYYNMGFGDFLKEFITPVVVNTVPKKEKEFMGQKSPSSDDLKLNDLFIKALSLLSGENMTMSPHELTYAVSPRVQEAQEKFIQVPRLQAKYNCEHQNYFKTWKSWQGKGWSTFPSTSPPCTNATESKSNGIEGCCRLREEIQSKMPAILKVMNYAIQPPSFFTSKKELENIRASARKAFPYQLFSVDHLLSRFNLAPRILECQYNKHPIEDLRDNCNWFGREFTDEGLGYSFNTGPFWDRHNHNEFMDLFYDTMFPDERFNWSTIAHPVSSGRDYGLKLSLRLSDFKGSTHGQRGGGGRRSNSFKIAIHDPSTPANFRGGGIEIKPGYLSSFLITPFQTITTEAAKGLNQDQRKCRVKSETDGMNIFKMYSQGACELECKIRYGENHCGCVPWNYPRSPEQKAICDYEGSTCFETVMDRTDVAQKCDCPLECDHIRYSISVSSTLLDPDPMCIKDPKENIFGDLDRAPPNKLKRTYLQKVEGEVTNANQVCRNNVASTAIVQFQITNQQMTRTKRDVRVTLADGISTFGGTVSLFTGMSILSVLEIFFWILRLVSGRSTATTGSRTT